MTDTIERESSAERESVVDYEGYRTVVDELSPAFRETGIVDAAGYDRAQRDARTVSLEIAGSVKLPLLTPIEHVSGYDVERSRKLVGDKNVTVMALPFEALTSQDARIELGKQGEAPTIIVETDHAETEEAKQVLPELLASVGNYEVHDFLDTRIKRPESQPAAMSIYSLPFAAQTESGEQLPSRHIDFDQAFEELEQQRHPLTEQTKLLNVQTIRDDEALAEKLWELCEDRFQWLGEFHPVSMEDTKDFFMQILRNDDTHTIVRYDDQGEPACLGFYSTGMDECEWLSAAYRKNAKAQAQAHDDEQLYFFGVASNSTHADYYARDVMQLLSALCQQKGGTYRLDFESTNMSSRYIPRMISSYIQSSDGITITGPIEKMAQIDYWYLKPTDVVAV